MLRFIEKIPKITIIIICIIFTLIIALLDFLTGSEFPLVILYFLPIIIVVWYINLRIAIFFTLACTIASALTEMLYGSLYFSSDIIIVNTIKRLVVFLVFALMVYALKRNNELKARNKLIIQRSQAIIDTTQRTTGIIVESITKHNLELLNWISKQKENGQRVPEIIETTQRNIGKSLSALSEASFCETIDKKELDIDDFISMLQKKLKEAGNKIFSKSKK